MGAAILAPAPDSLRASESVRLTARSGFSPRNPRVGDTVEYAIEVSWQDTRIPVLVLAPDSVDFTGLRLVDQSTRHEKIAGGRTVENRTIFAYTLVADQPGPAKAASLKVRYTTGISGRDEAVYAPAGHVEILPSRFAFAHSLWFRALLLVLALAALTALGTTFFLRRRRATKSKSQPETPQATLGIEVKSLRNRIGNGESRDILRGMEQLSLRYLCEKLAVEKSDPAAARFDVLLNRWLDQHRDDLDRAADWEHLRELFRQARYAGGHKEPHELQDGWRAMKRCLEIADEH